MYKDVINDHTVHGCGWTPNCPLQLHLTAPCRPAAGRQVSQGIMGGNHFAKEPCAVLLQEQAPSLLSLCHCVSPSLFFFSAVKFSAVVGKVRKHQTGVFAQNIRGFRLLQLPQMKSGRL